MNDAIKEQLSAFVDGELSDAESALLQRRLMGDDALCAAWRRYHLVRDAMRRDMPDFIGGVPDLGLIEQPPAANDAGASRRFIRPLSGALAAAVVITLAVFWYQDETLAPPEVPVAVNQRALPLAETYDVSTIPELAWETAQPAATATYLNGYLVDHSGYTGFGVSQSIIPYSRVAAYRRPLPYKGFERRVSE